MPKNDTIKKLENEFEKILTREQEETIVKECLLPARRGWVHRCNYCGEDAVSGKLCKTCRSKAGREEIFKANIEILKALRKKGYCKGEVMLIKP